MDDSLKSTSTPVSQDMAQRVEAELVRLLYRHAPVGLIATLLSAGVTVGVLWPVVPHLALLVWGWCVGVTICLGLGLCWQYQKQSSTCETVYRWRFGFLVLTGIAGTAWGTTGIFLFPIESVPHQVFLAFLLGGISAGAAIVLSPVPAALPIFILPATLPLCLRFFLQGRDVVIAMGDLSLAFVGVMLFVAFLLRVSLAETFALRLDNLDLIHDISLAKEQAENANRCLLSTNGALSASMQEAKLSAERFRSLCACSPIGIFQTDVTGACVYVNPRWQEIAGRSLEESLGFRWMKYIAPEDRETVPAQWRADLQAGKEFFLEFRIEHQQDGVRWVCARAAAMKSEAGTLLGYVGTFEDITERRSIDQMKDEFVSVVSHELRTPLTSIHGALGLVASKLLGDLSDKGQRMLEIAISNTDRLVRLINDILDIERLESGKVTIQKQFCNATALLTQAADEMQPIAQKACVTLSVYPQDVRLWADPDRIIQTLTNLLGNAIKFSPAGGRVWLTVEPSGEQLLFQVRDQGRGIPAGKLEAIFERFQQIDASDGREKGGSGLGLAISRSIVGQHGGKIWAESAIGQGSSFFFTLPALRDQAVSVLVPPPTRVSVVTRDDPSDALHILIAESDRDLGRILIALFERYGVVTYAQTGLEAMQCIQLIVPSLIVFDPDLPEQDGFTLVDWLRQHDRLQQVPLAIYSANDLAPAEQQRLQLGQSLFSTKGRVTPDAFEQHVMEWFAHFRQQKDRSTTDGIDQIPTYH